MSQIAKQILTLFMLGWLTACAGNPKQPLQCSGPWVPVNASMETRDGT